MNPDSDKVNKLHAQLLSELEAINHRSTKEKEGDREKAKDPQPNPSPKIKGVEAQGNPNLPPPPKPGKPPKGNPPVKPVAGVSMHPPRVHSRANRRVASTLVSLGVRRVWIVRIPMIGMLFLLLIDLKGARAVGQRVTGPLSARQALRVMK